MNQNTKRKVKKAVLSGVGFGLIIIVAIVVSEELSSNLETQVAVGRADLLVTAILTAILIAVYIDINAAEHEQSRHIENQVKLMNDQLAAAHHPQIAVDSVSFDRSGISLTLTNVGNGPATGINLHPTIEAIDDSGIGLEIQKVRYRWQEGEGDYIDAGNTENFSFHLELSVSADGEKKFMDNIGDVAESLQSKGIDSIHWKAEISFETVLGNTKTAKLGEHTTDVNKLSKIPEYT